MRRRATRLPIVAWPVVACLVVAMTSVAPADDLLPVLAASEVCRDDGGCWPPSSWESLHPRDAASGSIRLPPHARSHVYARVPAGGAGLEIELRTRAASLVITVAEEGGDERELYGSPPSADWQRARVDLGPWAGRTVRVGLGLRAEPGGVEPAGDVRVLRLVAPPAARAATPALALPAGRRPNVVVYLVDTLRADHLGCYGHDRPTSPRLDGLAASAVLFTDAVAQSSWTLPTTASLLTGVLPQKHGAVDVDTAIRADVATLAETFAHAGYATAAFVTNYLASAPFGHARGFAEFFFHPEDAARRPGLYLPSSVLHRRLRRWLARRPQDRPFFLYVHATDPHWPYLPPARFARDVMTRPMTAPAMHRVVDAARPWFLGNEHHRERPAHLPAEQVAVLRELYDGEIRMADAFFGRFVDDLAAAGILDETVIVFTSDHGEEFLDHTGLGHGQTLHEEVVRIPLLLRLPGGRDGGRRVTRPVQQVDVAPTLFDLTGVAPPPGLDGTSLLESPELGAPAFSQLDHLGTRLDAVSTADWRAIRDLGAGQPSPAPIALYDRSRDRAETADRAAAHPTITGWARQSLRRAAADARRGPRVAPALVDRLRQLGYLEEE